MTRKTKVLSLRLVLPLLLLGFMIADAEHDLSRSEPWVLKIAGGDPRDIFRGHYLQFRIDWNWNQEPGTCRTSSDCCVCLNSKGNDRANPQAEKMDCSLTKSCDAVIRGKLAGESGFDIGLNRYYVAETLAREVEQRVIAGDGAISIGINVNKNAILKDLLISGETWQEGLQNAK